MSDGNGTKISSSTAVSIGLAVTIIGAVIAGSIRAGSLSERIENTVAVVAELKAEQKRAIELNAAIAEKLGEISATLRAMDSRLMRIERDVDARRLHAPPQ